MFLRTGTVQDQEGNFGHDQITANPRGDKVSDFEVPNMSS